MQVAVCLKTVARSGKIKHNCFGQCGAHVFRNIILRSSPMQVHFGAIDSLVADAEAMAVRIDEHQIVWKVRRSAAAVG